LRGDKRFTNSMVKENITVELTADEALVLFEFVARFTNDDTLTIEHGGEKAALWHLCAALEKTLVDPLESNYDELLSAARDRLAEGAGTGSG
jgi:hypothetical protein